MTDPQPDHLKKRPTRAEPLQPDAPGQGDAPDSQPASDTDADAEVNAADAARRAQEQQETARKNTTEGYD